MTPLFGTNTKSTTVIRLIGCSVELQGSSKVGIQDTLVCLIWLMSWGGRLFLRGDRRLDLFCFTKLLTVWHKCCCCCLPTPMTLASGGSPMFPHVVHQPASPSIWPAVQSLRRGLSTNPGVTMWCVCGCS